MQQRSLFAWSLLRLLGVLLIASIFLLLYLCYVSRELRRDIFRERLQMEAIHGRDLLVARSGQSFPAPGMDYGDVCLELARVTGARITLVDMEGQVLGDSSFGAHSDRRLLTTADIKEALGGAISYKVDREFGEALALHHVAIPVLVKGKVAGALRITQTPTEEWGDWRFILGNAVLPLVVLGVLMGVCSLVIARKVDSSVDMLSTKMLRFAKGQLATRAGANEFDEFLPLTMAFDEMAETVEEQLRGLRLEKRQWEAVFTGMREGILAVDHDFNMLTLNQAARLSLGLSDGDSLEGRPLFVAVRNANLNHFIHEMFKSQDQHLERELEIRSPSGDITTYRLSAVRFTYEEEQPQGVLVVMHDITRVRRLENMRKEFVANVSHELKTPITSIKGFIETLEVCLDEPEQARRFISIITQQTDRLNAIIDDLLTLSRLEQADHWVAKDFESQDIAVTVQRAVSHCARTIELRKVEVELAVGSFRLYANHRLLEQAISNLVENAAKYSPEGAKVEVTFVENGKSIMLKVKDNGPGIPLSHHERIFQRFHRVDKSRDRQTGGTGLGLSIVKHIVRVHGGKVTVESTVGQGACFTITLPKRNPTA